jgi:hypothetical protein
MRMLSLFAFVLCDCSHFPHTLLVSKKLNDNTSIYILPSGKYVSLSNSSWLMARYHFLPIHSIANCIIAPLGMYVHGDKSTLSLRGRGSSEVVRRLLAVIANVIRPYLGVLGLQMLHQLPPFHLPSCFNNQLSTNEYYSNH